MAKKKGKSYESFSVFLIVLFIAVLLATALITSSLEKAPVARETATTGAVALVVQPPAGSVNAPVQKESLEVGKNEG
jgi:hypothetical protein